MEGSKKEQDQTECELQIEACYQKKSQWIRNVLELSSWLVILHIRPSFAMTHQTIFFMQMNLYMGVNGMIGVWCNL